MTFRMFVKNENVEEYVFVTCIIWNAWFCAFLILLSIFVSFEIRVESTMNSPANEILMDLGSRYIHSGNLFVVEMIFGNLAILDQRVE